MKRYHSQTKTVNKKSTLLNSTQNNRQASYLWTKAFCESLHATESGAELNAAAVQKHTQQSVGGTWIWYQLDVKITATTQVQVRICILLIMLLCASLQVVNRQVRILKGWKQLNVLWRLLWQGPLLLWQSLEIKTFLVLKYCAETFSWLIIVTITISVNNSRIVIDIMVCMLILYNIHYILWKHLLVRSTAIFPFHKFLQFIKSILDTWLKV